MFTKIEVQYIKHVKTNRIHLDNLDCIRAISLIYVLITHLLGLIEIPNHAYISSQIRNLSHFGSFGVIGFFTLSSFLLASILLREKEKNKKIGIRNFYLRRILRIFPLYFVSIGLVYLVDLGINRSSNINLLGLISFSENWQAYRNPVNNPLTHFWSISVEVQFYFLLPFVISLKKNILNAICLCGVILAIISRYFIATHADYPAVWNFSSSHMDAIFLGIFLSLNIERIKAIFLKVKFLKLVHLLNFMAIIAFCFYEFPSVYTSRWSSLTYFFVSLNFGILIIAAVISEWTFMGKRILVYLGKRSYGIYIIHYPLIVFFLAINDKALIALGDLGLIFGITLVVAELSFRNLEQPFLRVRRRFQAIETD